MFNFLSRPLFQKKEEKVEVINPLERMDLSPLWQDPDDGSSLRLLPIVGIVLSIVNTIILILLLMKK